MAIKKLAADTKPPRRWAIVAYPGVGKSTFGMRMKGPLVVANIDRRISEVHTIAGGEVGVIELESGNQHDANAWADQIARDITGAKFGTLIGDSITPVIEPLFYDVATEENPKERNKLLLHKAATANHFFNAFVAHGNDVLLVWHLKDTMVNGQGSVRTTLSKQETARLKMHLNAILEITVDEATGKRGIVIVWARNGRGDNHIIWDESGSWVNMPEKIEQHIYGSQVAVTTTVAAHAATAAKAAPVAPKPAPVPAPAVAKPAPVAPAPAPAPAPVVADPATPVAQPVTLPQSSAANFNSRTGALIWAVQQNAFADEAAAVAAYEAIKKEKEPKSAGDMFQLWRAHVATLLKKAAA